MRKLITPHGVNAVVASAPDQPAFVNETSFSKKLKSFFPLPRLTAALLILAAAFSQFTLRAEGTCQIDPNPENFTMLMTGRADFASFATWNGPESSRLYFQIKNTSEFLFLGLSEEFTDDGEPFSDVGRGARSGYRFRIMKVGATDPVHGPFDVNSANANVISRAQACFGSHGWQDAKSRAHP